MSIRISPHASLFAALALALATAAMPAAAYCGKQCKEAKKFCSHWEKDHPGEECGRVRGAICNAPGSQGTWDKIKQVNAFWAACHLVKGEEDHKAAQKRCRQVEDNEDRECEVHSPRCNAGWVKVADFGKFQACREIELSGSLVYDGYKAWMRKWEGLADTPLPPVLARFVEQHYPQLDAAKIRIGVVKDVPSSTCITDCNHLYCDRKSFVSAVGQGVLREPGVDTFETARLLFHELGHAQECVKLGSREAYAKNWFKSASAGFVRSLAAHDAGEFKDDVHDLMPTEQAAEATGRKVAKVYEGQWWNRLAHCRIYKADRKTVVHEMPDRHTRAGCTPGVNPEIEQRLQVALQDAADAHGSGVYWLAHGRPDLGEPKHADDDKAGFWIGSQSMKGQAHRVPPKGTR